MSSPPALFALCGLEDAPAGKNFGARRGSPGRGKATLPVIIVIFMAVAVEVAIALICLSSRGQQGNKCLTVGMQRLGGEGFSFKDSKTIYRATQEDGERKEERRKSQVCCILM